MKAVKSNLFFFTVFLVLLGFTFRSLLSNISSNLPDWYDYPYLVWIIDSNLDKFVSFDFSNLFNTNILYPHPNNLLLTDTLFTQSILGLPARVFTQNPILTFNLIFLITFAINYISSFMLWKTIFKKESLAFLGALLTAFSPFFHAEGGHFQLQSYWPSFFALYFLINAPKSKNYRHLIICGLFVVLQFLASVYLAVFLIGAIFAYYLAYAFINRKFVTPLKKLSIIIVSFTIIASPVIIGYLNVNKQFQVERNYSEYVFYSAHLSDYLFSGGYKSLIHTSQILGKWNSFNHHSIGSIALFPGFILTILGLLGILRGLKRPKTIDLFFFLLICVGIIFSFGPRVNFNGNYAAIPLPYHFLIKYIPIFEVIRAPARWMFLAYIGFTYFSLKFLYQKQISKILFVGLTVLVILEYLPVNIKSHSEDYIRPKDETLKEMCLVEPKPVILEIPVTHFDAGDNILEGLNYITKTILVSGYHKCNLINGYGSYDLPSVATLTNSLYDAALNKDSEGFLSLIESSGAQYIVVNEDFLKEEDKAKELLTMVRRLETKGYLLKQKDNVFQVRVPN
jgi:hypothetical protein